jgi:hypothetical protein
MSCGCKKKVTVPPAQQPARIIMVEHGEAKGTPPPIPPPPIPPPLPGPSDIDGIVSKLNEIIPPQ